MDFWRLTREAYQALDGEGARRYGGRWNSEGVAVVYSSSTLALAALEYLVHVDPADVPADLVAMRLRAPDGVAVERIDPSDLPPDWNRVPDHPSCIEAGERWVAEGRVPLLCVPSAIVPEEENVLINPRHEDASRIEVVRARPFSFDRRPMPAG